MKTKGKFKWIIIAIIVVGIIMATVNSGGNDSVDKSEKVGSVNSTEKSEKDKKSNEKNNDKKNNDTNDTQKESDNKYHPGDIVKFGDFEITFISAKKYKSKDSFVQPREGYKYVEFKFTFMNKGETDNYPGTFECYANNKKYEEEYLAGSDEGFVLQEISAGRELSGSVVYEVPKDTKMKDIEVEYENNSIWSDKKIIFLGK